MNRRAEIETVFGNQAFELTLFYSYPGGLRFELSEGGTAIEQFLTALKKAGAICASIFSGEEPVTVCLRFGADSSKFSHRSSLQELKGAGINIPKSRSIWSVQSDERTEVMIAFHQSATLVNNLLWCALASDFGSIRPRPLCSVYLFSTAKGVMAFPYDDRGMDVVGPNRVLLSWLYRAHHQHLLEYDLELMQSTFGPLSNPLSKAGA